MTDAANARTRKSLTLAKTAPRLLQSREPGRVMTRPRGCRSSRLPESPSPAPGAPSDDTTVLEAPPRRAARRMASASRRGGAVLVLALAALAAPLSTAQAQTVLWEQTMTVGGEFAGALGWNDAGNHPGGALSDSDETFEYDGHTYDLSEISSTGFELILSFDVAGAGDLATKATRDKLTFHVGAAAYNLGTAQGFTDGRQINWGRVLTWSAGDMLALKITTTDPGAPALTATPGVAAVTLNWTAPTSTGGTAITGYEYRQRTGDAYADDAWTAISNSASLTSYDVTGLTAGTAYTFQLRARNASGAGVYSDEVTVTPAQTPSVVTTTKVSADGTYAIGATITVSGTPQLALDVGGETRQADYASGSGAAVLVFSYTVADGDEDTDGIRTLDSGLTLNGGTISAGGTAATLNVVTRNFSGLLVDGVRPTLNSATVADDGNSIDLVFDEPYVRSDVHGLVTFGAPPSVTAAGSSVTVGTWSASMDADGKHRTLQLNDLSATITYGQVVIVSYTDPTTGDDANVLQDAAGNDVASFTTGSGGVPAVVNNVPQPPAQTDTTPPALASATVAADGTSIDLVFDEPYDPTAVAGLTTSIDFSVTADGSPVTIGGLVYGTEEGMTLDNLAPAITHGQIVIVSYADDAANDAAIAVLQDAAGNDVASFTTGSGGVPAVVNTVPQPVAPTVSSVTPYSDPGADDTYGLGDTITVAVEFTAAVTVTGTPQITLRVGGGAAVNLKPANYASGSGTSTLRFSYVVQAGDMDDNGIYIEANELVRGRCRHHQRLDLARVEPLRRRHGGRARGCRARARTRRDQHPRPLPQPFTDYHDPRRPPAPDLVDLRCACAASR